MGMNALIAERCDRRAACDDQRAVLQFFEQGIAVLERGPCTANDGGIPWNFPLSPPAKNDPGQRLILRKRLMSILWA